MRLASVYRTTLERAASFGRDSLNRALVQNEQIYVQAFLDRLNPALRQSLINDANRAMSDWPGYLGHHLKTLGHPFNFGSIDDRIFIGNIMASRYNPATAKRLPPGYFGY